MSVPVAEEPVLLPPEPMPSGGAWIVPARRPPWEGEGLEDFPPRRPVVRASVVLGVHDRAETIEHEVSGLLARLHPRDEVVVVDDASSDATVAVLDGVDDDRLRVLRTVAPRGTTWATNLGIRWARGRLLVLVSSPAADLDVAGLVDRVVEGRRLVGITEPSDHELALVGWSAALRGRVGHLDATASDPVRDLARRVRQVFAPAVRHDPDDASAETPDPVAVAPSTSGGVSGPRPLSFPPRREPVIATVASMPSRRLLLAEVVRSVLGQVDELWVYLNDYPDVPAVLDHPRVRVARSQDHGDLRDNGKFHFDAQLPTCYHLTMDDDLRYPRDYVDHLVAKVEQFDRRAVVGVHGALLHEPERTYFEREARTGRHFSTALDVDDVVDVLGTGTLAMHTSTLRLDAADMPTTGMADIWLAVAAHRAGIPLVAVARPRRWVREQPNDTSSLFHEFVDDDAPHVAALSSVTLARPDPYAGIGSPR